MGQDVMIKEMAVLSLQLQATMLNVQAFERAVERGYIRLSEDGQHLRWMLGNNTLLTYFCGRMWSGDRAWYSKRKDAMVWEPGRRTFPGTELGRVFGYQRMRQKREDKKNMVLSKKSELVDILFVT